jgi:hypothetical protein
MKSSICPEMRNVVTSFSGWGDGVTLNAWIDAYGAWEGKL